MAESGSAERLTEATTSRAVVFAALRPFPSIVAVSAKRGDVPARVPDAVSVPLQASQRW